MASANFSSQDRSSWYYGKLSRKETQDRLQGKTHGTFLVRDSNTCIGDYVLSVSENSKVSHYIINQMNGKLKIGEQEFHDLPELLEFYKVHYLDTTTLIQPSVCATPSNDTVDGQTPNGAPLVPQPDINENVVAQFDFRSDDSEDLPFTKGEILEIIGKPEDNWWTARNSKGQEGQIPVPYVKPFVPNPSNRKSMPASYQQIGGPTQNRLSMPDVTKSVVYARAKMKRVPSAYDPSALAFEVGDRILVTKMNKNGQWEGRIGNRSGTFPFTHVDIIENNERN